MCDPDTSGVLLQAEVGLLARGVEAGGGGAEQRSAFRTAVCRLVHTYPGLRDAWQQLAVAAKQDRSSATAA